MIVAWGQAPNKWNTFPAVKKCSQLDISVMFALQTKSSSVLDMGRRPKLKSDYFFVCKAIVVEISRCENFDFFIHTTSFSEPDPVFTVIVYTNRILSIIL